jgi:hypothetical protein
MVEGRFSKHFRISLFLAVVVTLALLIGGATVSRAGKVVTASAPDAVERAVALGEGIVLADALVVHRLDFNEAITADAAGKRAERRAERKAERARRRAARSDGAES